MTSVCVVPPNETFSSGLIVTGGNDNMILVYEPDSPNSIQQLSGHEDTGMLDLFFRLSANNYFCISK